MRGGRQGAHTLRQAGRQTGWLAGAQEGAALPVSSVACRLCLAGCSHRAIRAPRDYATLEPGRLLTPCHTCAKRLGVAATPHVLPLTAHLHNLQLTQQAALAAGVAPGQFGVGMEVAVAAAAAAAAASAVAAAAAAASAVASAVPGAGAPHPSAHKDSGSAGMRHLVQCSSSRYTSRRGSAHLKMPGVHASAAHPPPPPPPPGEVLPRTQCYHMYKGLRPCGSGSPPPPHTHTHLKMPVMCASAPPVRRASTYPPASSHRPCSGGSGGDELSRPVEATLRRSREARLGCTKTSESGCRRCRADKQLQQRCTCELAALCG